MVGEDGDLLDELLRNDRFVVALDVVLRDGGGLKFIMDRSLEYHQNHPYPFWINKFWPPTSTGKSKETRPQPEQLVRIRGIRYDESADDPAAAQRLFQRIRSLHKRSTTSNTYGRTHRRFLKPIIMRDKDYAEN